MPWKASSVVEERLKFVARLIEGEARAQGVTIHEHTPLVSFDVIGSTVLARTPHFDIRSEHLVHATGAWTQSRIRAWPVTPRKGQMLRVAMPPDSLLRRIHRGREVLEYKPGLEQATLSAATP